MLKRLLNLLLLLGLTAPAQAFLESPAVLPEGINSVSFINGRIGGLDHYYNNQRLTSFSSMQSIEFDLQTLRGFDSRINDLYSTLNQFAANYGFGNALHMGTLELDLAPEVNYHSLVYARGLSKKWTVAVGLSFIDYNLGFSMQHVGSNIPELKRQFGGLSPDLDNALSELNVDARNVVQDVLQDRGYEPLATTTSSFFGDSQLINFYQFHDSERLSVTSRSKLILPTGPADRHNSLTSLDGFNMTSAEQALIAQYRLMPSFSVIGLMGYLHNFTKTQNVRVPLNTSDTLPDVNQLQTVDFTRGAQTHIHVAGIKNFNDNVGLGVGYNFISKQRDQYLGASNLSILEDQTDSQAQTIDIEFSYSTVKDYFNKKAMIPYNLWFSVSDVFSGVNTQRKTDYALWLMVFF